MSNVKTRVIFDRESLMKIKEFVVSSPDIFVPIKIEYNRRISVESVDEMANRTKPIRRRFTSYNSDDTGNSEDLGEWIDAGSKTNNNSGFNRGTRGSGFRGPHRGGFIQKQKSWRSNYDLEPVADTGEDTVGGQTIKRNFKPPGLDSIKWFYIDLEGIERGPFSSHQMLEWFKAGFLSVSLRIRRSCDLFFKTIAIFFSTCKGSTPFEVNTLLYMPPILVAEDGLEEPVKSTPDQSVKTTNFWHYLPDCGSLQGPFSGAQMQEWLNKKLIYPTLKVRRIDQTQFFDLGELIKIVPDAFTNCNISLEDLNSLLDVSLFRQTALNFSRQVSLTDTHKKEQDSIGNVCIGLMSPERGNKFWYFKDGDDIVGPITPQEMKSWFDNQYLPGDLLCRKGDCGEFFPLEKICNTLVNPFSDVYISNKEVRNSDSLCSLCNNVDCLFRGSSLHLPVEATSECNQVKDPCVRLKNFACEHANAVEKVITLNDVERVHEINIPGNPRLRITRTFVRMRHCDKDDYEYSIMSTLNNNPPIENSPQSKMIEVKTTRSTGQEPKSHRPNTKPVHVDLNDSLFNNIQFVFGSQGNDSSLLEDEKEVVENDPPPVAPKRLSSKTKPNGPTVWSGNVSSIVGKGVADKVSESVQADNSSSIKANPSGDGNNKSNKKKSKPEKADSDVKKTPNDSNKTKQVANKKEVQSIAKPQNINKQPIEIPQENEVKGTEDSKKKKKPNKQQAFEEECQKRQEEQKQKILQQLITEQQEEQERRRVELEKQQAQMKALKAKKNLIINDMKEQEKMENQLNQITLPKQAAWASTKSAVNHQKISFADIQSQQAIEMAKMKAEQISKCEPATAPPKQTSWVNVATVTKDVKPSNQNMIKKTEIKFNDPKGTDKIKPSSPAVKKVESNTNAKGANAGNKKTPDSPISIWNISDAGAMKKNLKDKSLNKVPPSKIAETKVLGSMPNETLKSPESKSVNNQRQDLIVWCSKQMINLKDYTKIQSIDSDTMANLLCDLDDKDDVSKFVEDCFGKSKMIDKFVKDFSQKKNRLLNSR